MKRISIKTVDGGRFDYIRENDAEEYESYEETIIVREKNTTVVFAKRNIVCIEVKKDEES